MCLMLLHKISVVVAAAAAVVLGDDVKNWAIPGLFSVYFRLFKQILQFLQQICVKNVHPAYGAGIRTHDLNIMSLLP